MGLKIPDYYILVVLHTLEGTIQDTQKVARASFRLAKGMIGSEPLRYLKIWQACTLNWTGVQSLLVVTFVGT